MLELANIDLTTDPAARVYVKNEQVEVAFAQSDGELVSREGPNRYQAGDALITGSTGDQRECKADQRECKADQRKCKADRWSVSRRRFDEKYQPVPPLPHGDDGRYQARPIPVLAKQMPEPFTVARSRGGDMLRGLSHDWLLQYAPGDYGIVENARFERVYRLQPLAPRQG